MSENAHFNFYMYCYFISYLLYTFFPEEDMVNLLAVVQKKKKLQDTVFPFMPYILLLRIFSWWWCWISIVVALAVEIVADIVGCLYFSEHGFSQVNATIMQQSHL